MKRIAALLAAALLFAFVGPLAAKRAYAASGADFSVAPATSPSATEPRAYFDYQASPGDVINDRVTIANYASSPLKINVYPADAFNIPTDGNFSLRLQNEPRVTVGSWAHLTIGYLVVPPKTTSTFPFSMALPPNVAPGDYAGGIVAVNEDASVQPEGAVRVGVKKAVGARIYLRVKGPLSPSLDVVQMHVNTPLFSAWPLQTNNASLTYEIVNSGNVRLDPTTVASVKDVFGRTVKRFRPHKFGSLLPGQKATITERWGDIPTVPLRLTPHIVVSAQGASTTIRQGAPSWVIPWVLLLAIAIIGTWLWRRRRNRASRAPAAPGPPAPASTPEKVSA